MPIKNKGTIFIYVIYTTRFQKHLIYVQSKYFYEYL